MNDNKLNGLRYADSTLNSSTSRIKFGVGAHEQFIDERLTTEMVADVKIRHDTTTGLVIFDLLNEKAEIIATRYLDLGKINYTLTKAEYDAANKRLIFTSGEDKIVYCDLSEMLNSIATKINTLNDTISILSTDLKNKQDKLTAGNGIEIDTKNNISIQNFVIDAGTHSVKSLDDSDNLGFGSFSYGLGNIIDNVEASAVFGKGNTASGNYNFVTGYFNTALGDFQTVIGTNNLPDANALFIVGNGGYESSEKSNAFEVLKDGVAIVPKTDKYTMASAVNVDYLNTTISNLTQQKTGGAGKYITSVFEQGGIIYPEEKAFDTVISPATISNNSAPTSAAVSAFVNSEISKLDNTINISNNSVITKLQELNGIVTAEYSPIAIDKSQVNGLTTSLSELESSITTTKNTLTEKINEINEVIPNAASTTNKLADQDFVNSSIENMAAFYVTYNAAGDPFPNKEALKNASTVYISGVAKQPGLNDYCIVLADESQTVPAGASYPTTRYTYSRKNTEPFSPIYWNFQYIINNSGLTSEQLAAINSGITKDITDDILEHLSNISNPHNVTKSQVGLGNVENKSLDTQVTANSTNYITSGAVKDYVDTYGGKIDVIKVAGTPVEIVNKAVNLPAYSFKLSQDGVLELDTLLG